jgi:hypothetical protein
MLGCWAIVDTSRVSGAVLSTAVVQYAPPDEEGLDISYVPLYGSALSH